MLLEICFFSVCGVYTIKTTDDTVELELTDNYYLTEIFYKVSCHGSI